MTTADAILYLDEATTGWLLTRFDPIGVAARAFGPPADGLVVIALPDDGRLTVVADSAARRVLCLISSRRFREVCGASTVATLARSLMLGRQPVVCVLGDGRREVLYVEQLLRGVPGIVHVVVCRPGPVLVSPVPSVRHRDGITVAVTGSVPEALMGADLVLILSPPGVLLDPRWIAPGTAILDATGAVDLATLGTKVRHAVSPAELAAVTTGLAAATYRMALDSVVGVQLSP